MSLIASTLADVATKAQASVARFHSFSSHSDCSSGASSSAESASQPCLFVWSVLTFFYTVSSRPTRTQRARLSPSTTPRANEHLAVLLPKNLWKVSARVRPYCTASHLRQPDPLASTCDNFYCRVKFTVLERRHVRVLLMFPLERQNSLRRSALQKVWRCFLSSLYLQAHPPSGRFESRFSPSSAPRAYFCF